MRKNLLSIAWVALGLVVALPARADEDESSEESSTEVHVDSESSAPLWHGLYFRAGALHLQPAPSSKEVVLSDVSGTARLAVNNGPIAGSAVGVGSATIVAVTVGYQLPILDRQLSIETILAMPFTIKLTAKGTLSDKSLAPYALGNLPTGVPAVGSEMGETKVLPPVVTAVYRFLPQLPVHPYLGAGFSYMVSYDSKITNPILTQVAEPELDIPAKLGWVVQAGLDIRIYEQFFFTADVKYIGGLNLSATVKDLYVKIPDLPIYDSARVGNVTAEVAVNPFIFQGGVGMNF